MGGRGSIRILVYILEISNIQSIAHNHVKLVSYRLLQLLQYSNCNICCWYRLGIHEKKMSTSSHHRIHVPFIVGQTLTNSMLLVNSLDMFCRNTTIWIIDIRGLQMNLNYKIAADHHHMEPLWASFRNVFVFDSKTINEERWVVSMKSYLS